ncbi:glycosyltransferase [Stenotrophomonas sp. WHRI 8082]|uniref:glycosyltransferase n=1 Tax=Stenotrophomonas sp. WHRI 8082 TaxID=3162571 RepID=UPI0032EDE69C
MAFDLSVVITFHKEGLLAHATLRSYALARRHAASEGCSVQFVLVLDNVDAETRRLVSDHPDLDGTELIVESHAGDSALARNAGVSKAGGRYICTLDGDDLINRDYFHAHVQFADSNPGRIILHPEFVVSFGMYNAFNWQIDQRGRYYSRDSLLLVNFWISAVFASREVFTEVPYVACFPGSTGFGYEDWYWNCETTAVGYEHLVVPRTAYFYRRKLSGSVNEASKAMQVVMPRSRLFDFKASV